MRRLRRGTGLRRSRRRSGWTQEAGAGGDVLRSGRMSVTVGPDGGQKYAATGTQGDIAKFFSASVPRLGISIKGADGKSLLEMKSWEMSVPNHKEGNADILYDRRPTDPPFYQVGATFVSPSDEHYYGLGQNHEGYLDRRGHAVRCAHDYNAPAGPSVCVPFVVTNKGYGLDVGQPGQDDSAVRVQRGDEVDLGCGAAGVVFCDCRARRTTRSMKVTNC